MSEETLSMSLTRDDHRELLEYVPRDFIEFRDETPLDFGENGEPVLILATLALTSTSMLTGLCAWLASKGRDFTIAATVKGLGFETSINLSSHSSPEDIQAHLRRSS